MIYILCLVAFTFALVLTLVGIPIAKRSALRWQLVDLPDEKRKLHLTAIPLVGGISIFVGTLFSLILTALIFFSDFWQSVPDLYQFSGLFLACLLILLVGVIDDRYGMRGRQKLLGQIIAATILIVFGFRFDQISIFGQTLDLQIFSVIAVYAWILVGINSVNLLDGADGFASTIGFVMCVALCIMSLSLGRFDNSIICAAMAGSILAFLRFNFPPASVYLGDAGSMLIGLFISAMAIRCSSKEAATYAFFAPIALLAIPMFDTIAAIVRRQLTGRSIYTVDRGHLHHALMRKGFGPRKALLLFTAMCVMTATGGTLSLIYRQSEYAIASITAVIVFLIVGKVFGFAEFRLIANRVRSLVRSFFAFPKFKQRSHQVSVRLQGERDWDLCWQVLREFAEKSKVIQLTMDLNLPWIHESFHAKFQQADLHAAPDEQWNAELPLTVKERIIGRIDIRGSVNEVSFYETVSELADVVSSLQPFLLATMTNRSEQMIKTDEVAARDQSREFGLESPQADDSHALDVG